MKKFNQKLQEQFEKMCSYGKLFKVKLTGQEVWDLYLRSFSKEDDPVFRDPQSTVHNCNLCNNFIRRYGNIVAIDSEFNIITLFDFVMIEEYSNTVSLLSSHIKDSSIIDVFFETFDELKSLPYDKNIKKNYDFFELGIAKNVKRYTKEEAELYGVVKPNETRTFQHIHLVLPNAFVDLSDKSIENIMGHYRDKYSVFKRGIEEITLDTLKLVRDLIKQGSLLDGDTHLFSLDMFIAVKETYKKMLMAPGASKLNNWCWVTTHDMSEALTKFRNTLLGVLCTELSEGEELNKACKTWNQRVDPINYMKASAPITQRQIKEAQKFVEENNYVESFDRRFAILDDIKVSEILHSNVGDGSIKSVSIFDSVKSKKSQHKRNRFDDIEEVSIEKFMKDILPNCTSVEAFLDNKHSNNFVTLTTARNADSKPIFKWPNNYSWTFNGNLAGKSQIKEAVKGRGGDIAGILRFSIMWAKQNGDNSDLDAHCNLPGERRIIYYSNTLDIASKGRLDVDIQRPESEMPEGAVENITFPELTLMSNGEYLFRVHQFQTRNSKGFEAEIEFDGNIYSYEYPKSIDQSSFIDVAKVTLKDGVFTIEHLLSEQSISKEIYGLESNQFQKVNLVCLSPNHWNGNSSGNKHYFFMLEGAKTPVSIRSFHIENLIPDLLNHRKVMEILGTTNKLETSDQQLSGLGFNATVRDEVILKLAGNFKRIIKVKF